jgi:hypothetical protein
MWRMDAAIARLAHVVGGPLGIKVTQRQMMPWSDVSKDDPDYEATPEDMQRMFGARVRKH